MALRLGASVISAHSMQIYRGMDIGTGKILPADRKVGHYGIDISIRARRIPPFVSAICAPAVREGRSAQGRPAFWRAARGCMFEPQSTITTFLMASRSKTRFERRISVSSEEHGAQALWEELAKIDAESAGLIHPNNTRRVIRAFEIIELEGTTYARQHQGFSHMAQFVPAVFVGLAVHPAF